MRFKKVRHNFSKTQYWAKPSNKKNGKTISGKKAEMRRSWVRVSDVDADPQDQEQGPETHEDRRDQGDLKVNVYRKLPTIA